MNRFAMRSGAAVADASKKILSHRKLQLRAACNLMACQVQYLKENNALSSTEVHAAVLQVALQL